MPVEPVVAARLDAAEAPPLRPRRWKESQSCKKRSGCISIEGHYGPCMGINKNGRLVYEDGRPAIGATAKEKQP